MTTRLHWLDVLGRCRSWLATVLGTDSTAQDSETEAAHPVILMKCSLRYACDSLDAVTTELLARRPLQAGVLVRTMFELAVRVRWAGLHDHGWERLMAYWIQEHKKSLSKVQGDFADAAVMDRVKQLEKDYGAFLDGVSSPQTSRFKDVLKETVQKTDESVDAQWIGVLYNGYRDLCRYAHANMTVCAGGIPISDVGPVLLVSLACSTVQFVEASSAVFGVSLSDEQLDDLYGLVSLADKAEWALPNR